MCILTNAYRRGYFWIFVIKSKKNSWNALKSVLL
jgi:hypothetical protein